MTDHMMMRDMRLGETHYIAGDRIDLESAVSKKILTEENIRMLTVQKYFCPLTREAFEIVRPRRPAGSPWPPRGFTIAQLELGGIIDPEPVEVAPEPAAKAPKGGVPAKTKGEKAPVPKLTHVVLGKDAITVGDAFLQPGKNGRFDTWHAADREGRLLRPAGFRSEANGIAFLKELQGLSSTETPPADTSGGGDAPPEEDDDRELRSRTGD